ncbi:hypothetical protein [Priestia megaterium]|uniref:hypothetical protein n=1 Tax=Priestia megaterium TaxID=1404 RepID=UPI0020A12A40|nr:hypothetical protein [Priestia megaterium]MCP1450340.1 hypothetical protein [Priestia megaterium]
MIKFNISNALLVEMEEKHINSLKHNISSAIAFHKEYYCSDENYIKLLSYIEKELNVILCGKINDLKKIIYHIEKNFYIAPGKLTKISEGAKYKNIKGDRREYIQSYIEEKNLDVHLLEAKDSYEYLKDFKAGISELKNLWESYSDQLSQIFNYSEFIKFKGEWKAYDLVQHLGISVCPYCNRQYINTLIKEEKRARAVLDHFYAKSLYPYLALSLYNLIPCCYFCNSTFKGDKDFYNNESLYPYEEGFSNYAKFETDFEDQKPYDYRYLLGLSDNFKIKISIDENRTDPDKVKKIERSKEVFHLEDMYSFHRDYVKDLIRSMVINDKSRIDEIYETYEGAFQSREEVMQILFLNYIEEINFGKRPLSKLTQDIFEELNSIYNYQFN